jgi:hypothetical protein
MRRRKARLQLVARQRLESAETTDNKGSDWSGVCGFRGLARGLEENVKKIGNLYVRRF